MRLTALAIRTMSKENNIDKLFRNSLQDQEYSFNEDAWGEMESMLDARSSKTSWYRRSGIAASLLLLISIGSYWYIQSPNNIPNNIEEKQVASVDDDINVPLEQNEANNLETKADKTVVAEAGLLPKLTSTSSKKAVDNGSKEEPIVKNRIVFNRMAIVSNLRDITISTPVNFIVKEPAEEIVYQVEERELIAETKSSKTETNEYDNYDSGEEYLEFPNAPSTDPVDKSLIVNKRHSLDVSLANTFNHGFSNNSGIFGNNFINSIGIEYAYQLNDKFIIGSGVFYKSKTGNGLNIGYSQEQYGFGRTTTNTTIQVNSLHYAEIPLFIDYQVFQKHHFIGGATFSYLTGVRNRVMETKTETLQGTQTNFETQWGLKDHFNSMDLGIRLGYEYELTKNFKVGASAQFGLLDFTNDAQWASTDKNRHQELQISLKYKFLRF